MKEAPELFDDLILDGQVAGCVARTQKVSTELTSMGIKYRLVWQEPGRRVYERETE